MLAGMLFGYLVVTKRMTSLAPSRGGVKALKSLNTLKYYRI
jgi:hypothetical protein